MFPGFELFFSQIAIHNISTKKKKKIAISQVCQANSLNNFYITFPGASILWSTFGLNLISGQPTYLVEVISQKKITQLRLLCPLLLVKRLCVLGSASLRVESLHLQKRFRFWLTSTTGPASCGQLLD